MTKKNPYTREGTTVCKHGTPIADAADGEQAERLKNELNALHTKLRNLTKSIKDHWFEQSLPGKSKDLLRHYRERVGECVRKADEE